MPVKTLVFLVVFLIVKTNGYQNLLVPDNVEEISTEAAIQISNLLTLETGFILVTNSLQDYENAYVDYFLKSSDYPLEVAYKSVGWSLVKSKKMNNFIVISSIETLEKDISTFVHRRGFYLFILNDEMEADYNDTLPFFRTAWNDRHTLHVYFLTSGNGVVAYDPFTYNSSALEYGAVMTLADRKSVDQLFLDLNGYPLTIEIFRSLYSDLSIGKDGKLIKVEGADPEVAFEIARQMNFEIVFQDPDKDNFGYRTENGSFNGALGRVIMNKVDMTLTSYFIKDYFSRDMEFTVAVYSDQLCCYVPKADRVPQSILPLFSFSPTMWLCYFMTALLCGLIWSMIRCFNLTLFRESAAARKTQGKPFQFVQIFIDTWIVWVRVALRKFPGFNSEKWFLGSVCLVSVIFGAIFESSLATVYIKPLYYKDITTLQELDASGFKILYKYASMGDDTFGGSSPLFTRLSQKMRLVQLKESVMVIMSRQGGFASITRKSSISLENVQFFASNELFMIPECPKTYTLAYILPKDSPYAERVNLLLLCFLQAGLIDRWIDQMYFAAKLADMINPRGVAATREKVLTLHDLQLAFIILLSGGTFGFVALLSEACIKRRRLKKPSKVKIEHFK